MRFLRRGGGPRRPDGTVEPGAAQSVAGDEVLEAPEAADADEIAEAENTLAADHARAADGAAQPDAADQADQIDDARERDASEAEPQEAARVAEAGPFDEVEEAAGAPQNAELVAERVTEPNPAGGPVAEPELDAAAGRVGGPDHVTAAESVAEPRAAAGPDAAAEADSVTATLEPTAAADETGPISEPAAESTRPAIDWDAPAETFDLAVDADLGGRPIALRMASLHLRAGLLSLARAELEALAGRARLDEASLLDLAEVRWRCGDLPGAGDAANALLARGSEPPLALVIAAEAVAAAGRPSEARRLSARAIQLADGPLDPLFAGMPRALIWPAAPAWEPATGAARRRGHRTGGDADGAPSTAAEAFAGGRAALARGDAGHAALLLGVALRLDPDFAEDVLRAVAGRDDQPLLALVRGDALRLMGRETEALEAFDRARGRSSAGTAGSHAAHRGPGLFDDDPAIFDDDSS